MINISCRKCGSINIRKNGLTDGGAQKYHRRACEFCGTLITQEEKQKKKRSLQKNSCTDAYLSAGLRVQSGSAVTE